jgi:hypothetical protein
VGRRLLKGKDETRREREHVKVGTKMQGERLQI